MVKSYKMTKVLLTYVTILLSALVLSASVCAYSLSIYAVKQYNYILNGKLINLRQFRHSTFFENNEFGFTTYKRSISCFWTFSGYFITWVFGWKTSQQIFFYAMNYKFFMCQNFVYAYNIRGCMKSFQFKIKVFIEAKVSLMELYTNIFWWNIVNESMQPVSK